MDPKSKSSVTHSRGTCVCDHCGLKLNRHNLKAHTQNAHPGFPVKERVVGIMSLTQFVHRVSKNSNNNEEEVVEKVDEVNSPELSVEADPLVKKKNNLRGFK